jgi:3-hydroxyacyl-[acyl-carrier-protein] dehydratase
MVDEVLELEAGKKIVASKTMPESEELFTDHFPGFPVVPGVLLTEMMAQAGGKCLFAEDPERGIPILGRIKEATFRDWVPPGKKLLIHAEVSKSAAMYGSVKARVVMEDKTIANADLSFTFVPASRIGAADEVPEILSLEV